MIPGVPEEDNKEPTRSVHLLEDVAAADVAEEKQLAEEIEKEILTEEALKHKQSEALSTSEDHVSGASRGISPVVLLQSGEGVDTIPTPAQLSGTQKESRTWTIVKGRGQLEGRSNQMQKHQPPRNRVPCQRSKKQTRQERTLCDEVQKLLREEGP